MCINTHKVYLYIIITAQNKIARAFQINPSALSWHIKHPIYSLTIVYQIENKFRQGFLSTILERYQTVNRLHQDRFPRCSKNQ